MQIDIQRCPSCGGPHQRIEANQFRSPADPWSHWYQCPKTGDPVSLRIDVSNGRAAEVDAEIMDTILEASQDTRGYVVAVFTPTEDNRVQCRRFSRNFNTGAYVGCVEALRLGFEQETGVLPSQPLEAADIEQLKPVVNIFGEADDRG